MIRKITALVCVFVMMLTVIAPGTSVFAAREASCWNVSATESNVTFEDGVLMLDGTNGTAARWTYTVTFPESFTVKFSAKIHKSGTMGIQIFDGAHRSGMYMRDDRVSPFGGTQAYYAIGNDWHDYRVEVDKGVQSIYIDNTLVTTQASQANTGASSFFFWGNEDTKMEVGYYSLQSYDGKPIRLKSASYAGDYLPGDEYTEGFYQDWKTDTGNWYLVDNPAVEWDKEEGVVRFDGSKGTQGGYYPMQHAVKFTKNFDWKWKMRIIRNVVGTMQFKYAGDGLNSYFYVEKRGKITGAQYWESLITGKASSQGMGIPIFLGDDWGDWVDYEIQRRGNYLTLLVDGGKVKTWRTYAGSVNPGILSYSLEGKGIGNMNSDLFEVGPVSYTPYLPTIDMTKPVYNSEYAQGTDVELQATASEDVDYIDYYVDDVKVGRGYAPDYTYILENVQVGTYNISAGVGDERSVASVMTVKPAFSATLQLSNEEIKYGASVEASIVSDELDASVAPVKVEYYVNGKLAATATTTKPFKATLKGMNVGTASVYAKVTNAQGVAQTTDTETVDVYTNGGESVKFGREYDISYKYESGTGKVEAEDGYFKLSIQNEGTTLKYLDADGTMKEYAMNRYKDYVTGYGEYRVITTSGYAEVYYNGQLLHSFYMPRTTAENKLSYSGVKDFRMTGSGCKYTLFSTDWAGEEYYTSDALNVGVYSALEFDKTDLSDEVIDYYDGRYHIQLRFEDGKLYARDQGKTGCDIKEKFALENPAEVGYYRVNVTEGVCQVWCNNKLIGGFAGPLYAHKPQIIRQMTNPSASTFIEVKNLEDIYYHSEDFSGNKEMAAYDYWLKYDDVTASINSDNGKYFTTINSKSEGKFYLNAFTKNNKFSAKVKVDSASNFYMLQRFFSIYYYTKLGYDFDKGVYFAEYDATGGNSAASIGLEREEFPGKFETGVWHDVEVITDETNLVMFVDGKKVIDTDFWFVQSGCSGFGVVNGTLHFTDVEYEGRGKVGSGALTVIDNSGSTYNDFVQLSDGRVASLSTRGGNRYTSDAGKTWTAQEKDGRFNNTNVLQMADGRFASFVSNSNIAYVSFSDDDGVTMSAQETLPLNHERSYLVIQNNFSNVAKNGRLLVSTDEGMSETSGKVAVYWSDDNGATWKESDTFFEETVNGINTQEASLIDMPEENHYRIFFRTDRNFIYYADSYDGCKTFDQMKMMPSPFKAPVCTFKIKRDIYEDQTYYALWTYDTENDWHNRYGCPRNRVALAVSRDGMKTWEFVQTVFDIGDYPIGLVRNYSLKIIEDTIYISMNGQSNEGFLMTIDKNKLKTTQRFEEVHQRTFYGTTSDEESYSLSVIPNKTGEAWILGNYETVEVQDGGMVAAESLAKAFKSEVVKSGNTVTFKIGDGYVKFTEGSTSYDVNGTVTDFGSVCLKNGYVNIEACAKAFGRTITENKSGNGWVIWSDIIYTDYYREQLESLI